MTSPRVTAHSTVRTAHEMQPRATSPWSLSELAPESPDLPVQRSDPEQIQGDAAARHDRAHDEGHRRGFAEGIAHGASEAERRLAEATAVLSQTIADLESVAAQAEGTLEENVAALAVIVARHVIEREVTSEPQIVADLVRRALTEFPVDQSLRIHVHPLDLSLLSGRTGPGTRAPITGTRDASWVADALVTRGGCLIEGRDRIVDGRVDTALERAYRRMASVDAT